MGAGQISILLRLYPQPLRSWIARLDVRDAGFAGILLHPAHVSALTFRGSFGFRLAFLLICHSSTSLFELRISKWFY
jgi:hypothetical protein